MCRANIMNAMYIKLIENNPWTFYSFDNHNRFASTNMTFHFTPLFLLPVIFSHCHNLSFFLKHQYINNLTTFELIDFKIVIAVIHKVTQTLKKGRKGVSLFFPAASRACFHRDQLLQLINSCDNHDPKAPRKWWNHKTSQPTAFFPEGDNH